MTVLSAVLMLALAYIVALLFQHVCLNVISKNYYRAGLWFAGMVIFTTDLVRVILR